MPATQPPDPPSPAAEADPSYRWRVLMSVVFGVFMIILDATVVNVAFPTLQREFAASVSASQWVLSLYIMMLGISTPLSGYLGDRFGEKRMFLTSLIIFTAGSFLCGISPSLGTLIAARALQGFGGGIAIPLGTALLYAAFPREERGKAMGFFGIALVVAPALGPILGGWLVDVGHWRWIFFINVPIGLLGILVGSLWLHRDEPRANTRFDVPGFVCSTIGFGAALYGASVAADQGWHSPTVVNSFIVAAVALAIFTIVELRYARDPLLDLRLFAKPIFTLASLTGWVSVVALFGAEFLMPIYLQLLRGRSAFEAGLLLLPMAIASAIATPLAGRVFDRIGARVNSITGFALLALNTWQLARLTTVTPLWWVQTLLAMRGVALGLTVQTTFLTGFSVVPLYKTARASALINATRQVVQAIAVALLATILSASVAPEISLRMSLLREQMPAESGTPRLELCTLAPAAGAPPPVRVPPQAEAVIGSFCNQYMTGMEHAYRVTFYASLVALLLGTLMPGWPGGRWGVDADERTAGGSG